MTDPSPIATGVAEPERGDHTIPVHAGRWLAALVASVVTVGSAVALEVLGGSFANSPVGSGSELVPLTWPQPARVAWWLLVAGAAGLARLSLHRIGIRQRPVVVVASVIPFIVFAGGVAAGAEWATWH